MSLPIAFIEIGAGEQFDGVFISASAQRQCQKTV